MSAQPTFKFQFRVTASTGSRIEITNNPGASVTAEQLRSIARDFFTESVPGQIERAERSAADRAKGAEGAPS